MERSASSAYERKSGNVLGVRVPVRGRRQQRATALRRDGVGVRQGRAREVHVGHRARTCKGARLKPESLAVTFGGINIAKVTRMSVDARAAFFAELRAQRARGADRAPDHQRDPRAAALPRRRRPRLPDARPHARPRCRAARRSASAWRRRSARRSWACSTSSTSRRSACISATTPG